MSYQVLTFITTNQSENPLYFSHAEQAAQRYHTIWRLLMANIAVKIENLVKRYGEVERLRKDNYDQLSAFSSFL